MSKISKTSFWGAAIGTLIENTLYRMTGRFTTCAIWPIFIGLGLFVTMKLVVRNTKESLSPDLSIKAT